MKFLIATILVVASGVLASAADWPMFRHDRLRSAVTTEQLALPLTQVWSLRTRASQVAPKPQDNPTGSPYPESARYNVPMIAVGDAIYFSSAADGRVVCLDAATGTTRWEFVAGGMNRSPTFSKGRLYIGSSDGNVYCLDATNGKVIWTFCAAPASRWFLYYGKMISCWAVMTDVQVFEGVAYFAAGVFPHDGTFLYAVDAETGKLLWRSSQISENGWRNSLAPGGHLYVTQNNVWVPKDFGGYSGIGYGNGLPFRRADGKYLTADGGPDPERPKWNPTFMPLIGAVKDGVRYCGSVAWKVQGEESKREIVWQHEIPGRCQKLHPHLHSQPGSHRWSGK